MESWKYEGEYDSQTNVQVALRVSNRDGAKINFYHSNFEKGFPKNRYIALELLVMVPDYMLESGFNNFYPDDQQLEAVLSSIKVPRSAEIWTGIAERDSGPIRIQVSQEQVRQVIEPALERFSKMNLRLRGSPMRSGKGSPQEYNTWVIRLWKGDEDLDFKFTLPPEKPLEYLEEQLPRRLDTVFRQG